MRRTILSIFSLLFFILSGNAQQKYLSLFENKKSTLTRHIEGADGDQLRATTLRIAPKALKSNKLPEHISLNLFDDVVIDIALDAPEISSYKGLIIYRGRSENSGFKHLKQYRDLVIIVNPNTGALTAQIEVTEGSFQITPTKVEGQYRVVQSTETPWECHTIDGEDLDKKKTLKTNNSCEERDQEGKYVADLFVGYSYAAAARINDIDGHAQSLVEMVNNGLNNSKIEDIYVRLVGTGLNPENPGVVTSVLGSVYTWYEDEIAATSADYVASIQVPTGGENEAGGWAGVGGYSSVNSINSAAAVFRHEIGHNVGSSHCNPGIRPYAAGYSNGTSSTHMCGNNVNFYSTPLVLDDGGLPLGDAETADNARLWRERAATVSARRKHTIPYDENDTGCDPTVITNGRYHIINVGSEMYLATENESTAGGTKLIQTDAPALSNEWDLINMGINKFKIKHAISGRSIDVPGSNNSTGTDLIIWNNHSGGNQIFTFQEVVSDTFTIKTFNGLCFNVENMAANIGDVIEQNECTDQPLLQWRLVPVTGGSDFNVVVTVEDATCFGSATGMATVAASGGSGNYTYLWEDGSEEITNSGLLSGTYTVTVSDGSQSIPYTFSIGQSVPLEVTITSVAGDINQLGQATVEVIGGVSPITFLWSNGETDTTATQLQPGLRSVVVTNGNGCSITKEVYVLCASIYKPCDDGNANTQGDHIDENCNCVGQELACIDELLMTNVAIGKPTQQSSVTSGAVSSRVVDGNPDGIYNNGSVSHTQKDSNEWWEVDLGAVYEASSIIVWNRTDCCIRRLDGYYVMTSEEPFDTTDLDVTIADPTVNFQLFSDAPLSNQVVLPAAPFRYLRIQLEGEDVLSLAEVEVFVCGEVDANIVTVNPLDNGTWEIKGSVSGQGRNITEVVVEYGEDEFLNSMEVDITGTSDFSIIAKVIRINSEAVSQQFRIKVLADGRYYYSDPVTIAIDQDYCTPASGNDFWYKRFSKVVHKDIVYQDGGNVNYEDQTAVHFGELKMDSSYVFEMTTPSSSWTNLFYIVYIDLNNDGDFEDYNEEVGTSRPMGHTTPVNITIPHQDLIAGIDLRMRILGHEGGAVGPCSTPIGNYKDFTISILDEGCQGTGHIAQRYADTDGDGYGNANIMSMANCNDESWVTDNTDFNDNEQFAYPNAPELCDDIDNNGNQHIDEGASLGAPLLTIEDRVIESGVYTAAETIHAKANVESSLSSDVRFYTGYAIVVDPKFTIPSGAEFQVIIKADCAGSTSLIDAIDK